MDEDAVANLIASLLDLRATRILTGPYFKLIVVYPF
jgi:hypothetical protein